MDSRLPEQKYNDETAGVSSSGPACSNTHVSGSLLLSVNCVIQFRYPAGKLPGSQ